MPELPEVETVMRGLMPAMTDKIVARVELRRRDLRFPFPKDFAGRLTGHRVTRLERRAKYILVCLDSGDCLLIHLGMSGRIAVAAPDGTSRHLGEFHEEVAPGGGEGPHDHVVLTLSDGTRIVYTDPRRFGAMDVFPHAHCTEHKLLRHLGIEPLEPAFDAGFLANAFAGKQAPLKAALLDQRIVAGLGNIYVCEALYRAGLSPKRKAGTLAKGGTSDPRLAVLIAHIRAVLNEAIAAGGSTLRDHRHTDGAPGRFQQVFAVYGRAGEPCVRPGCGGTIGRIVQSGRSTFHCPRCQR